MRRTDGENCVATRRTAWLLHFAESLPSGRKTRSWLERQAARTETFFRHAHPYRGGHFVTPPGASRAGARVP
eukprot:1195925-Prorocentrum_minimum.AAC.2